MPGDRELAIAAGCDDYDTKPVDFNRLVAKIEAQLDRRSPQREKWRDDPLTIHINDDLKN